MKGNLRFEIGNLKPEGRRAFLRTEALVDLVGLGAGESAAAAAGTATTGRWIGLSALERLMGCVPGPLAQAGMKRSFGATGWYEMHRWRGYSTR
jgi:hypothetical protein